MKTPGKILLVGLIAVWMAGLAVAQDQTPPTTPSDAPAGIAGFMGGGVSGVGGGGNGMMQLVGPSVLSQQKEKGSYLGVAVASATPELRAQVGLKPGFGLVVNGVEPASPAEAAGVKQYDVLTRFDDQQLVNCGQLVALVRAEKPGDTVQLTVIRQGQSQTLTAKITEAEVPVETDFMTGGDATPLPFPGLFLQNQNTAPGQPRRVIITPDSSPNSPGPWKSAGNVRILQNNDNGQTFIFMSNQGSTHLTICDSGNHALFDGPVDTPEQRNLIPAELNKTLQELMKKNGLTLDDLLSQGKPAAPATPAPPAAPGV